MHVQGVENNKGSAIIEMTFLIPVILGCVFMYVSFLIFFIGNSKGMEQAAEQVYMVDISNSSSVNAGVKKQSEMLSSVYQNCDKWFDVTININRNGRNVLKSIRRWQLATSKI